MTNGLVGKSLPYSLSVVAHKELMLKDYKLMELDYEQFENFIKGKDYNFLNVTTPYKEQVIPFLDEIDNLAKEIGAVNTIINKNGKLVGYNTDYYGIKSCFVLRKIQVKGKTALILGSGGTRKTAEKVLIDLGVDKIYVCSRTGEINYGNVYSLSPDIIINATPVGTFPNEENSPIDLEKFNKKPEFVFDCVYNPIYTKLIRQAKSLNIPCISGLAMLGFQAIKSESLAFDGITKEMQSNVFKALYTNSVNIVLVGMGGAGKSKLAKLLSQESGIPYYDTDEIIFQNTGKTPNELITEFGEEYMRNAEKDAIIQVSKLRGVIIATGGGSVINEENADILKASGKIYFIKRSLYKLARKNRPLYTDFEKVKCIYKARLPIYKSIADKIISNEYKIENAMKEIFKDYYENITY